MGARVGVDRWIGLLCLAAAILVVLPAEVRGVEYGPVLPLEGSPSWRGQPVGAEFGTSADMDGDGSADLLLTERATAVSIYYGTGSGLESDPGWRLETDPTEYTGEILTADLQGDGFPELILIRNNQAHDGPAAYVYANDDGRPGKSPVWISPVRYSYGGAVGDLDGDGVPDLYVAGQDGPDAAYRGRAAGAFEDSPFWTSDDDRASGDAEVLDVDGDGDLDVAIASHVSPPLRIFLNLGGTLETQPSWECESELKALTVTCADADGDGLPEVALGCWSSPSAVFWNVGGTLEETPRWTALPGEPLQDKRYWSHVAWGDLNGDGAPELAMGSFWYESTGSGGDHLYAFRNDQGGLATTPTWTSAARRVCSDVGILDLDGDGNADLYAVTADAPELHRSELEDWDELGVRLWMPARDFRPGDPFCLRAEIANPGAPLPGTPVFVLLEAFGGLWGAPGWRSLEEGLDGYELDVLAGPSRLEVLPEIAWPAVEGSAEGLCFYGAMTDPGMTRVLGRMDAWTFGYRQGGEEVPS